MTDPILMEAALKIERIKADDSASAQGQIAHIIERAMGAAVARELSNIRRRLQRSRFGGGSWSPDRCRGEAILAVNGEEHKMDTGDSGRG